MRKYSFRKYSAKEIIKKHGFKIAALVTVLGLGIATYTAVGTLTDTNNPQADNNSGRPVDNVVSGITDNRDESSFVSSENNSSVESEREESAGDVSVSEQETESVASDKETLNLSYPEYFYLPVNGTVAKEFSNSLPVFSETMGDWRTHNGVDLAAEKGERVISAAHGEVTDVYYSEAWGWVVEINHGGNLIATYCNLNEDVQVAKGDLLKAGQLIGGVGDGGYEECEDGSHLHIEMCLDGKFVDPVTVMHKKTA